MVKLSVLWAEPDVNPISRKARSLPLLNPFGIYGGTFWLSALGFCMAFWAWYALAPLLTVTLARDLGLSSEEVANSNIVSISAALGLRVVAGPLCDQIGPRKVFAYLLLLGCIPVGLTPLVSNAAELYAVRFFTGTLGASFVPCQVWCTAFFDKNVVGTANAVAGGWGDAGGGLTYLIIPAIFDSLMVGGMPEYQAWRVTLIVPLICLIAIAVAMLALGHDTPLGPWSELPQAISRNLESHGVSPEAMLGSAGSSTDRVPDEEAVPQSSNDKAVVPGDHEASIARREAFEIATAETVKKPTLREALAVTMSLQTLFHVATYACSFGGALAINNILAAYYSDNFDHLGQTAAGNYAAVFGFLNFVTRPLGGIIGDLLYRRLHRSLWAKKLWIVTCGVLSGTMLIVIGQLDIKSSIGTLVGVVSVMAFFMEAGNGANFSLVPHVHPHANGIISGLTGAGGNIGGVAFAVLFRFVHPISENYAEVMSIIGIVTIAVNIALVWVKPLPKGQMGGR